MKTKILILATIMVMGWAVSVKAQKANLDGSWVIVVEASDIGKADPAQVPKRITIKQKYDSIVLSRVLGNNTSSIEVYNFNGMAIDTIVGAYKKSSSLKWSDDAGQFTISAVYHVTPDGKAPWQFTKTEIYSLSADGKTLTLDRVSVLPDRTETIKVMYKKQ